MSAAAAKPKATTIRRASIDVVRNVQASLLTAHYREVAKNQQLMKLDPDWPAYYELEERGLLITLVATQGDSVVGYSVNIVVPRHLHYRNTSVLQNDVLYVSPVARGRSIGVRLIQATVEEGRKVGAAVMLWHAKDTDSSGRKSELGPMLQRLGYGLQDIIYSMEI